MRTIAVFVATTLVTSQALAAGFILNEHDAAATGRGGTFVANPYNAGAIFFNPAGIAAFEGWNLYVGGTFIDPSASFDPAAPGPTVDATTPSSVTPDLYATYRISEVFSAGLGVFLPFGSTVRWPASSPGRQILRDQELRTIFFSPVLGINLSQWVPGLSIGGGPDLVPSTVELKQDIVFGDVIGKAHLGGTGFGVGGRVGVRYAPAFIEGLSLGFTYRSAVSIDYDGDVDIDIDPVFRQQAPPDGPAKTHITTPQSFLAGIAYNLPGIDLELEFDLNWIGWNSYDELPIDLPGEENDTAQIKNWDNTLVLRGGVEYRWNKLAVRGGYVYDPTPIPDTTLDFTLPDIDRHVVTFGLGYQLPWKDIFVDAAALHVIKGDNTTSDLPNQPPFKGTYEVSAWVFALHAGVTLGEPEESSARSAEALTPTTHADAMPTQ